jgi:hypothetical protein
MEATVPLGDGESLERLRERTEDAVTRSAGSTTQLAGHDHALDLVGALVDLGDRKPGGSFHR